MEKFFIFWIKPWCNPFEKCKFLGLFYIDVFYSQIKAFFVLQLFRTLCIDTFCIETKDRCFYSLKRLPFFLELHKTLFIALFCINRKDGKLLIFWPKPWTNPFGKMQIFDVFLIDFFTIQIKLLFVLKYYATLFIALFCIKTIDGKRFNFWTISEQ